MPDTEYQDSKVEHPLLTDDLWPRSNKVGCRVQGRITELLRIVCLQTG